MQIEISPDFPRYRTSGESLDPIVRLPHYSTTRRVLRRFHGSGMISRAAHRHDARA